MAHFTYKSDPDITSLCQGDVLKKSDDLIALIREVHPYFERDDYKYFLVLTQSCDLIKRNSRDICSAKYITIAAIRPLRTILEREAGIFYNGINQERFRLIEKSKKQRFEESIKRLFNNNKSDYFYLHNDDDFGFYEPCVATLRVSVAIKASQHYQKCLDAKILELEDEFKAKLGWLVGNLYSRVGTKDWSPINISQTEFNQLVADVLNRHFTFIENLDQKFNLFVKNFSEEELQTLTEEEFKTKLLSTSIQSKKDSFKERLTNLLTSNLTTLSTTEIKRTVNQVVNDTVISDLIKK